MLPFLDQEASLPIVELEEEPSFLKEISYDYILKSFQSASLENINNGGSTTLAQRYLDFMESSYEERRNNILLDRKDLVSMRYDVDDKLKELKESNVFTSKHDAINAEDESYLETCVLAEEMPLQIHKNIKFINNRIEIVEIEKTWLEKEPASKMWTDLESRHEMSLRSHNEDKLDIKMAQNFFQSIEDKQKVLNIFVTDETIQKCFISISHELLDIELQNTILSICIEIMQFSDKLKSELDIISLKTTSSIMSNNKGNATMASGQSRIYLGALHDLCDLNYKTCCISEYHINTPQKECLYSANSTQIVNKGGYIINSQSNLLLSERENKGTRKVLYLHPDSQRSSYAFDTTSNPPPIHDKLRFEELIEFENYHFKNLSVSPMKTFLTLPRTFGEITAMKIMSATRRKISYLILGSIIGTVAVFHISWSIATTDNKSLPYLMAMSPPLPRNEISKVVDLQFGSSGILDQFMSLHENGHIRVWCLKPAVIEKSIWKKAHSKNIFRGAKSNSVPKPTVLSCRHHISPSSMNLPDQRQHSEWQNYFSDIESVGGKSKADYSNSVGKNKEQPNAVEAARLLAIPQINSTPKTVCFHPSTNLFGRNSSIIVGSQGGDIMKFNLDFIVSDLQCSITNVPPFVDVEYVIPGTFHEDLFITSGNKNIGGNAVHRELFHFHKSKIKFVGVVAILSATIISIDENNCLVQWNYSENKFSENCWFSPEYILRLDFGVRIYKPCSALVQFQPSEEDISRIFTSDQSTISLRCRKRYRTENNSIIEVFYPLLLSRGLMELRCQYKDNHDDITPTENPDEHSPRKSSMRSIDDPEHQSIYRDHSTQWISRSVIEEIADSEVLKICMSNDGNDIFFLTLTQHANYEFETHDIKSGSMIDVGNTSLSGDISLYASIITYHIETKSFIHPYPKFPLLQTDKLLNFHVGPISAETLTRLAFVHVNNSLRMFSLATGREISPNRSFPYSLSPISPSSVNRTSEINLHLLSALCPAQRILASSAPNDSRVFIHKFQYLTDQEEREKMYGGFNTFPPGIAKGLSQPISFLQKFSLETLSLSENEDVGKDDVSDNIKAFLIDIIINTILPAVDVKIASVEAVKKRINIINEIYGRNSDLGVIEPTEWNYNTISSKLEEGMGIPVNSADGVSIQNVLDDDESVSGDDDDSDSSASDSDADDNDNTESIDSKSSTHGENSEDQQDKTANITRNPLES